MLIDISATKNGTEPDFDLIEKIAYECRMPFCYGGGIKNLSQIKDNSFNNFPSKHPISKIFILSFFPKYSLIILD